jgi:hypothetical protein
MFAQHRVLIKKSQSWTVELESELMRFPFSKHNDQVDALTQYLAWIGENPVGDHVIMGSSADGARIERMLSRGLSPAAKGDSPMRPRANRFRRR